jgi:hypothetical protein
VATQPRSPSEHYIEATRLLAAAESPTVDQGLRDLSARLALAHAVLTLSPRRARRVERPARHANGSPEQRWLFGRDDGGADATH